MLRQKIIRTLILCAVIVPAAVAIDFLVNVVIAPGHAEFTPVTTLAIATAVALPFSYHQISQRMKVQAAHAALAESLKARDSAEAASQAKSEFLANVSHELRTPLNAIINYSEMMLEGAEAARRTGDISDHRRVLRASEHLLRLIDDLLDYADIDAGRMIAAVEDFDLKQLVEDAAAFTQPLAAQNGNALDVELGEALGMARTDPMMVSRCLLHLLSNAAKFTKDGRIRLRARRQRADNVDWIIVQVADSGIGISAELQAKMFHPLTQGDASATRAQGGAGMGLAMTRKMAQLLGGDVSVMSAPGKGSVFSLRVPATFKHDKADALAA